MKEQELTHKEKKCRKIDLMMTKENLDNLPEASKPNKQITIVFDDNSTHQEVIRQFVDKLFTHDFASRKEIVENLKIADILLDIKK